MIRDMFAIWSHYIRYSKYNIYFYPMDYHYWALLDMKQTIMIHYSDHCSPWFIISLLTMIRYQNISEPLYNLSGIRTYQHQDLSLEPLLRTYSPWPMVSGVVEPWSTAIHHWSRLRWGGAGRSDQGDQFTGLGLCSLAQDLRDTWTCTYMIFYG